MRINEITQEQKVNIKCLISKCDKGKTVKDTPYLSLILEDATGVLDAKFWNLTNEQIEQYKVGQIVEVFGDSIIHRNAVQLRVRKMVVLEGEDISDYVRLAPMSRTEMEEEVKTLMNEITDSNLYCVVEEVLEETNVPDQVGSWDLSMEERFQLIVNAYKQLRDDYERGIKISEDEGDNSTNDLLIAYHTAVEKRIWMMSAELGKRPGEGE